MIETMLVRYDTHVGSPTKENQGSELMLFTGRRGFKTRPERSSAATLEVDSNRMKSRPDKS